MSETISDEEALAFFKQLWRKIYPHEHADMNTAEHLIVLDRLENEHAIFFYILDGRHLDDLRPRYYNGATSYWQELYYYSKASQTFQTIDLDTDKGPSIGFKNEEVMEFLFPEDTYYDAKHKLERLREVRISFLYKLLPAVSGGEDIWQMYNYDGPLAQPYTDPTRVPTPFDKSKVSVAAEHLIPQEMVTLCSIHPADYLAALEQCLTDLGITHWREGEKVVIDRYYPGRTQVI